jgi:acyl CoA:acetate/3-ketoacid CoA transferase
VLTFEKNCDRLFEVMRDKNMKEKTVKVMGPWVDGVRTVKEIPLKEWTSYTPLNRRVKGEWFRVVER